MIGQIISNYKITAAIGEGGMGIVYLAEHVHFNRKVAIKALHKKLISNSSIKERFRNEAATLSQIEHPNIVKLYDYVETEDGLFLVMEYVEGVPLDEYIKNVSGPIQESAAIKIMLGMLSGFSFAHSKNIVHRDVKPSNIIISKNFSVVKILDFGIAKILGDDTKNLTKDGSQMGTVYYMSPEQVRGLSLDKRSDIYSLGVTFFQMVTGVNPYQNLATEFEIYNHITQLDLPDAATVYPLISVKIDYVIKKATKKSIEDRYQNCEDFSDDLKNDELIDEKQKGLVKKSSNIINHKEKKQSKWKYKYQRITFAIFIFITAGYSIYVVSQPGKIKEITIPFQAPLNTKLDPIDTTKIETISIGAQIWATKNLDVSYYRNGNEIQQAKSQVEWKKAGKEGRGAWCYYGNHLANGKKFGKLYNWYAVNDVRGLAPIGWHVPSYQEWKHVINYLGGDTIAGQKMKSNSEWNKVGNGTNESGFEGLPGGIRGEYYSSFAYIGENGFWWNSTESEKGKAWICGLAYYNKYINNSDAEKFSGLSVRCIKDK